jgi:uncharacterized circularly permuted ATP-grasp superfamily protein
MTNCWSKYKSSFYDELVDSTGEPRRAATTLFNYLGDLSTEELATRKKSADLAIKQMGITFSVYSEKGNIDREWPFDIVPRIIENSEWQQVHKGLEQRLKALNLFINDLYHDQQAVKDGIVPAELFATSKNFRKQCIGIDPPHGVWAHICGSDLVRDADATLYVLEDNLRVPSGVSYMLENREVMKRTFPDVFQECTVLPVNDYVQNLRQTLSSLSPNEQPVICVLTPGVFNSAYFEHTFLAQQLGAILVEGSDLLVNDDDCVYIRNVEGLQKVDVIYRRVDDEFLDPEVFREDSTLGARGLIRAWKAGNVAIANAPGAGVADDKVVYSYVPDIIRYYLNEEPIIANVPTWRCEDKESREYVLDNLDSLVVKPANESGGYGMLIGPHSTQAERDEFKILINGDPRNYIAQPTLGLSTSPTLTDEGIVPRHVDLRPFVLQGASMSVTTGGLTRVAMVEGSLVVNSSQGGGSKDTWIVDTTGRATADAAS